MFLLEFNQEKALTRFALFRPEHNLIPRLGMVVSTKDTAMPKTSNENAPRFDTLLRERLYYLWCASYYGGKLPVDLKRQPPSNRGIVAQMIAQGLFEKKRGSTVALTDKGRAYMKRHGEPGYKEDKPTDISLLTEDERDLLGVFEILFLNEAMGVYPNGLGDKWSSLVTRGYFELVEHEHGPRTSRFRPTEATRSLVAGMGDKRIRAMIDKCEDRQARQEYGKRGYTATLALIDAHMAWPASR